MESGNATQPATMESTPWRNEVACTLYPKEISMHIGIAGLARSGKGEVANVLIEEFGLARVKFADPLKNMMRTMLADMGHTTEDIERYIEGDLKNSVIDGLHELGVVSRTFMIELGTKFGRQTIHPDLWVKLWSAKIDTLFPAVAGVVADDMRFVNEWAEAKARGAITILVSRSGTVPGAFKWKRIGPLLLKWFGLWWGVHDSERVDRLINRVDYVVDNNGTIGELREKVRALIGDL